MKRAWGRRGPKDVKDDITNYDKRQKDMSEQPNFGHGDEASCGGRSLLGVLEYTIDR